jgi:hypothetical protein
MMMISTTLRPSAIHAADHLSDLSWVRARLWRLIGGITWRIVQRLGRWIVRGWLRRIVQGVPPGRQRIRILGHKDIPSCFRDQCPC